MARTRWQEEHKEELREYMKRYRRTHREELQAYNKNYAIVHAEELQARRQRDYEKFKENRKSAGRRYYAGHREEIAQKRKRYGNRFTLKKYGLTSIQYAEMLGAQHGVCAVCNKPEASKSRRHLTVDHDHKTGKVRGLLCSKCNTALGLLGDNTMLVDALGRYVHNA